MPPRKHANALGFDPKANPITNKIRADLGKLAPYHSLAVVVRNLREQYQLRDAVLKSGKRTPEVSLLILRLHGYPKISKAAAKAKALKLEDDALDENRQQLHNFLDHAILSADSKAIHALADILEKEKNEDWQEGEGLSHPIHYHLASFKRLAEGLLRNNPSHALVSQWPPTATRLRRWVKERTGKQPKFVDVREAANQIGIPLGIGKPGRRKKQ